MSEERKSQLPLPKPLISVVLPSFNDREIIRPLYQALVETLGSNDTHDYEIIYVDDGSSDGSQQVLCEIASADPRVTYIELVKNFGQQRALFAGISASRGDYVVTMDGDFQYDPQVILDLVTAMSDSYDMASGIRTGRRGTFVEIWSSKAGNAIIAKILGVSIKDFGSIKAFSRGLVDRILMLKHLYSDVYPTALSLRPSIVEIPVEHKDRHSGRSHWNLWTRFRIYLDLYIVYGDGEFRLPFQFGTLVSLFGVFLLVFSFAWKTFLKHEATYTQLGLLSGLVTLVGMSFAFWALTMSFLIRIYKQNMTGEPFTVRRTVRRSREE